MQIHAYLIASMLTNLPFYIEYESSSDYFLLSLDPQAAETELIATALKDNHTLLQIFVHGNQG